MALHPTNGSKWHFFTLVRNDQALLLFALVIMGSLVISFGSLQLLPCCWQLILFLVDLQTQQTCDERRRQTALGREGISLSFTVSEEKTKYLRFLQKVTTTTLLLEWGKRWNTGFFYLGLKVLHGFLKGFGWSSLVVTEDGHRPVGSVIGQDFCWNAVISWRPNNDTAK